MRVWPAALKLNGVAATQRARHLQPATKSPSGLSPDPEGNAPPDRIATAHFDVNSRTTSRRDLPNSGGPAIARLNNSRSKITRPQRLEWPGVMVTGPTVGVNRQGGPGRVEQLDRDIVASGSPSGADRALAGQRPATGKLVVQAYKATLSAWASEQVKRSAGQPAGRWSRTE